MPYIHRDSTGKINGLSRWPDGSKEYLPDDNADVQSFMNRGEQTASDKIAMQAQINPVIRAMINREAKLSGKSVKTIIDELVANL